VLNAALMMVIQEVITIVAMDQTIVAMAHAVQWVMFFENC
jgi:hypothetical protein